MCLSTHAGWQAFGLRGKGAFPPFQSPPRGLTLKPRGIDHPGVPFFKMNAEQVPDSSSGYATPYRAEYQLLTN